MVVANAVLPDSRVLKTASTITKMGYDLTLFGLNHTKQVKEIKGNPFRIILLPNPKFKFVEEKKWPINREEVDWDRFWDIYATYLASYMNSLHTTVLHTHDMPGIAIGGHVRSYLKDKNIFWIHDIHEYVKGLTELPEPITKYYFGVEKEFIHQADVLTCVSPSLAKLLKKEHSLDSEPKVILNSPRLSDMDNFSRLDLRSSINLPTDIKLLVYSGVVKAVRGVDTLVEALTYLNSYQIAIITNSKGDYIDQLKRKINHLSLSDKVSFRHYVPSMNVTTFLRTADIGIHPIWKYPNAAIALPNKLFEYMHSGTPIIVSDNPTMAEFVKKHDMGLVFDEKNPVSLASAIKLTSERLTRDPDWSDKIKSLAHNYCWEEQELILDEIYSTHLPLKSSVNNQFREPKKIKILQLPVAAAGQPNILSKAINNSKVATCKSLRISSHKFNYPVDISLDGFSGRKKDVEKLSEIAKQFDVFHYHVRPLMFTELQEAFPSCLDILLLRASQKKVFFHFRGSEIRMPSVFKDMNKYSYADKISNSFRQMYPEIAQNKFIEYINAICNKVFVVDPELQTYVPNSLIIPRAIDISDLRPVYNTPQQKLKILHAPSNQIFKGTDAVLNAIKKLEDEGRNIEFIKIDGLENDEAMKAYAEADVVIDQLLIGWYGVLTVEAMALGKAVIAYIRDDLKHFLPNPPPLAIANPDTIYDVLSDLETNRKKITELGKRARMFVEENHDAYKITQNLIYIYENFNEKIDIINSWEWLNFFPEDAFFNNERKSYKRKKIVIKKYKTKISHKPIFFLKWKERFGRSGLYLKRFFEVVNDEGWKIALKKVIKRISNMS